MGNQHRGGSPPAEAVETGAIAAAGTEPVPLIVRTVTGKEIHVMARLDDVAHKVKEAVQDKEGIPPDQQRLVGGVPKCFLKDDRTLAAYGVRSGDTLGIILELKGDIGVFVSDSSLAPLPGPDGAPVAASDAPGAAWLASGSLPSPAPRAADVAAVVARVAGAGAAAAAARGGVWESSARAVGDEAAAALVALVDAAWLRTHGGDGDAGRGCGDAGGGTALARRVAAGSTADDFKLLLTPAALRDAVGAAAYGAMLAALNPPPRAGAVSPEEGREPDAVALRRTTPTGRWIGFHTDDAARTVQVPLTGDAECEGGRLVFALASGELVAAPRRVGAILAHDGDVVHGVTRLTRGMRYGLYLLRERRAEPALPSPALVA